eukprot:g10445.t1
MGELSMRAATWCAHLSDGMSSDWQATTCTTVDEILDKQGKLVANLGPVDEHGRRFGYLVKALLTVKELWGKGQRFHGVKFGARYTNTDGIEVTRKVSTVWAARRVSSRSRWARFAAG